MSEIPACSPPDRNPRKATIVTPPGAVDCHTHLFYSHYPLSPTRGYNPPDSTLDDMLHMHSQLGIERVVFTQPSVYGIDNSAIMDGMAQLGDKARAIIAVDMSITDEELADFDAKGARGVRLNLDNKGGMPITMDDVQTMAERIKPLGWHLEFLFPGPSLPELAPLFRSLPVPVSIGHFAYMPAAEGIEYPPFKLLLDLVREGNTWVKLSGPNRLGESDTGPWPSVVPMAHALIEANEDHLVWASDWPHPNKYAEQPNDADNIDQMLLWAPDKALQEKIFVTNAEAFYRF